MGRLRIAVLLFSLGIGFPVFAQTTSVSATAITDAGSVVWKNGTYNFQFVPSPVNPFGPYLQNGAPFNTSQVISGSLDNAGSFTQAVPDNKMITPAGSGWKFTVCPAATSPCFTTTFTITGASQVISVTPPAIQISMTTPPPGASAYTDSEIIGARQGQFYWNLTDNTLHICQLPVCTWVSLVTSPNGLANVNVNNVFVGNNSFPNLVSPTIGPSLSQQHSIPAVASDVFGLLAAVQTFTNKTLNGGTLSGIFGGNPAFSGLLTGNSINGVLGISNFGIKCDGVTDDSAGLNLIGTNNPAAGYTVAFPPNAVCVHASSITTWATSNLRIYGNGARLKFTGTGKQISLHNGAGEVDNVYIDGLILQGNPSATYNLWNDTAFGRGYLQIIEAQDATTACFYMGNVQLERLDLTCSKVKATAMGVPQVTQPTNGLIAGDTGSFFFANNRDVKLTLEGTTGTGTGLLCNHCSNQNYFYGTVEGWSVGVQDNFSTGSSGNIFSLDLESNTTDANANAPDTFLNMTSLGTFNVGASTQGGVLIGGVYQTVVLGAGRIGWSFMNLTYNQAQTSGTFGGTIASSDLILNVANRSGGAQLPNQFPAAQLIANQGAVCTNGELALSAGWQSTGSATVTAVSGTGQTCSWTITTGTTTAANPTVTDTLTNALPAATTVCELNIHGGTHTAAAGEGFQQTTLSATAPVFTFNGTPTAGGTTYFVTRRCGP